MGNRVEIERKQRLRDGFLEVRVVDRYAESYWFLLDVIRDESPEHLAGRCMAENRQACDILQAAVQNNTAIETPDGETNGALLKKHLDARAANAAAKALDASTTTVDKPATGPRF